MRPSTLQTYQQDGRQYSEQLSFYNFLLTGRWQKVLVPNGPIYQRWAMSRSLSDRTQSNCKLLKETPTLKQ